jgi:membrane protein involved in colicin uptake
MTSPTRRAALVAMLAGLPASAAVTQAGTPADDGADADLIRWCREYVARVRAYNRSPDDTPEATLQEWADGIWQAEAEADARPPRTLAGVIAKAQVVAALAAENPNHEGDWHNMPAGSWAHDVVRDMLRLFGASNPLGIAGATLPDGPVPPPVSDRRMSSLAAQLRAAEGEHRARFYRYSAAEEARADEATVRALEADTEAAEGAIDDLLAKMAVTPASGLAGIVAKAGRIAHSIARDGGLMYAEIPVARSMLADIERLAPDLVALKAEAAHG